MATSEKRSTDWVLCGLNRKARHERQMAERGLIREGYCADLVLFDAERILDTATFTDPVQAAEGIAGAWVNGVLSYTKSGATGARAGRFVARGRKNWIQ